MQRWCCFVGCCPLLDIVWCVVGVCVVCWWLKFVICSASVVAVCCVLSGVCVLSAVRGVLSVAVSLCGVRCGCAWSLCVGC